NGSTSRTSWRRSTKASRLGRLDPRAVCLDGLLPRGSGKTAIAIRSDTGIGLNQALVLDARKHVRHQDVGDREFLRRHMVAAGEPELEVFQNPVYPADQERAVLAATSIRRPVEHEEAEERRLDRVHRSEAPAHHLRLS